MSETFTISDDGVDEVLSVGTSGPQGVAGDTPTLPWFNVMDYGAVGDGVADDTVAIQDTVTAAGAFGTIYFPLGEYKVTDTITLLASQHLRGAPSSGHPAEATQGSVVNTRNAAFYGVDKTVFQGTGNFGTPSMQDLVGIGPLGGDAKAADVSNQTYGALFYNPGNFSRYVYVRNVTTEGFSIAVMLNQSPYSVVEGCHLDNAKDCCLVLYGTSSSSVIRDSNFANAGSDVGTEKADVMLWGLVIDQVMEAVSITNCHFDEANDKPSLLIKGYVYDTRITDCDIYYGNGARGILLSGADIRRTTISGTVVRRFGSNVPEQTIQIDVGAQDTTLINVHTDDNGGGDILDNGSNTVQINVNQAGLDWDYPSLVEDNAFQGIQYWYHPDNVGTVSTPVGGDARLVSGATGKVLEAQIRSSGKGPTWVATYFNINSTDGKVYVRGTSGTAEVANLQDIANINFPVDSVDGQSGAVDLSAVYEPIGGGGFVGARLSGSTSSLADTSPWVYFPLLACSFPTADFDTNSFVSGGGFVIPVSYGGYYEVSAAYLSISYMASGQPWYAGVHVNGTEVHRQRMPDPGDYQSAILTKAGFVTPPLLLAAGDAVVLGVGQATGDVRTLQATSQFGIHFLGA